MTEKQSIHLLTLVKEMREAQKNFERKRESGYRNKAEAAEKKVDEFVKNYAGSIPQPNQLF